MEGKEESKEERREKEEEWGEGKQRSTAGWGSHEGPAPQTAL